MSTCKVHSAHFDPAHYPKGCPMCVHPEDVIADLRAAAISLEASVYWAEARENDRHADQFKGILAKAKDITSDIESLLAGIREDANERARAA